MSERFCKCGRPARKHRSECCTCRNRRYDHPIRRLYRNLKAHAKERGKAFSLEFDWFLRWVVGNGYAIYHGTYRKRLHIDRVDHRRGYEPGNVQILTCAANCRKRWTDERELS